VTKDLGEFEFNDTHGSIVRISTHKRLGEAAGSFSLSFVPRALSDIPNAGGWQDVVEPQDYVEVFMWVPPRKPEIPVMRGWIDTVAEEFDIASGIPQRSITITGRDYGKLLLITCPYDIVSDAVPVDILKKMHEGYYELFGWANYDPNARPPSESPPMAENQITDGPAYRPHEMLDIMFRKFYKPQESLILAALGGNLPPLLFQPDVDRDPLENLLKTFDPSFFQRATVPFINIWDLMVIYQHKPWRELFVREDVDLPLLIYRPTPWLDLNGNYVQGEPTGPFAIWPIHETDIVNFSLMRTEAQLKNYFFTYPEGYGAFAVLVKEFPRPFEGFFLPPDNPYLEDKPFDISTSLAGQGRAALADYHRYGFRLAEYSTPYLDWTRNTSAATLPSRIADVREQGRKWNQRVTAAFRYNHLVESGAITLKGDERIQAGDYLRLVDRGRALVGGGGGLTDGPRYYVERVVQQFAQGTSPHDGHFVTHCEVSFGRGHIVREFQLPG